MRELRPELHLTLALLGYLNCQVQGFVKILRDNTERKVAEDRLYALTQESAAAQAAAEAAN